MEYSVEHTLTIRFDGAEVESFISLLDKLKTISKVAGFKKQFNVDETSIISSLHSKIILDNETNTN